MMNKATLDAAKQILFQGETDGVSLPREFLFSLELFNCLRWKTTCKTLSPEDVSLFVCLAMANHRPSPEESALVGKEYRIPSRNQTVTVLRPGAWDCLIVRGPNLEPLVIHRSRLEELPTEEEPGEPSSEPEAIEEPIVKGRKRLVTA